MRRRTNRDEHGAPWSRRRLLLMLVGLTVAGATVVGGLVLAVYYSVIVGERPSSVGADAYSPPEAADARTELAERPMVAVDDDAAQPGPLSTEPFEVITLPPPTRLGPEGVSSGFPQTPEGALAQLVAIDQAALQSASVPAAQQIIDAWAVPGGPNGETWTGVQAVAQLLEAAGLTGSGSPALTVSATPEMGLIKGTVGDDFVVACVDFVVTASMTQTARVAAADCQRMEWVDGRWMIGSGPEPAPAPSVWPGTKDAQRVGYKLLRDE